MGRDELTHDGMGGGLPVPPRIDGQPRYGDRFRPSAATLEVASASASDTVDLGIETPPRTWPTWLTRGAAGLGIVATAVVAVSLGDDEVPSAAPDAPPARSAPLNEPPPVAQLGVSHIEADVWDTSGFSYEVTVTNHTDVAYEVLDVGPAMSGTELAWDRTVVLRPGRATTIRVDFLVLNCLAATTSAAPTGLRFVVRQRGADPVTALAQVQTVDQAAEIDAAGKAICAQGGRSADFASG